MSIEADGLGRPSVTGAIPLWILATLIVVAAVLLFVTTQLTLFVVQPIGAVPEGRTLVIWRLQTMHFIDSADAWCARKMGGVNLLCRGVVLGRVGSADVILLRLPYSDTLYLWSTGGIRYDR